MWRENVQSYMLEITLSSTDFITVSCISLFGPVNNNNNNNNNISDLLITLAQTETSTLVDKWIKFTT
jgi:hypothetical protein